MTGEHRSDVNCATVYKYLTPPQMMMKTVTESVERTGVLRFAEYSTRDGVEVREAVRSLW